jgi:hypothetical protein
MKVYENIMHENLFDKLNQEIEWLDDVTHLGGTIPRRFALQASITQDENGIETVPLYRHPMDRYIKENPFTPTVESIRQALEKKLNCRLNHAILQCYRDGKDFISEHADKTLDVAENSLIVNYTAGATRILKMRSKDPISDETAKPVYDIKDIALVNDSAFALDMETNRLYKHSIRQDVNVQGARISITFRNIHTFYTRDHACNIVSIYGKGCGSGNPKDVLTKEELYQAWSKENHSSQYTWTDLYAKGYAEIS